LGGFLLGGRRDSSVASGPQPGAGRGLKVKAAHTRLTRALRRGLVLRVQAAGSGRASATATAKRKRVGAGAARTTTAGTAKVKVRFTRRAKRSLGRRRAVRLTLKVRFRPDRGPAQSDRISLRLVR